jgi:hypothetical protein
MVKYISYNVFEINYTSTKKAKGLPKSGNPFNPELVKNNYQLFYFSL